jgi:integration host factor subunit beta
MQDMIDGFLGGSPARRRFPDIVQQKDLYRNISCWNRSLEARSEEGAMTKADLIDEVSRLAELTRKDSEVIVETIFDSVVRSLRAGDKIEIRGFGSFRTRQRKPRVGRNPKTGERVEVPAKKIPFFKPSKELKDLVNEAAAVTPTPAPPATSAPPTA